MRERDRPEYALPSANKAKPTTTQKVRLHLDLELAHPHDAEDLKILAKQIEEEAAEDLAIVRSHVTQIIPNEHNFDWGDSS